MTLIPLDLPTLRGARLTLRAWRDADSTTVQDASHDPLIPALTTVPATNGEPEALAFIARQHDRIRTGAGYVFAIADPADRAVGRSGTSGFSSPPARARGPASATGSWDHNVVRGTPPRRWGL
jgi:ribosomal-protein-alanine N-acetyltransferase